MCLLMLLLCIALAWFAHWKRGKHREAAAAEQILDNGGSVAHFNGWEIERRGWLVRGLSLVVPRDCLYTVHGVWFPERRTTSPDLHLLPAFPHLREVSLRRCENLPADPLQFLASHRELVQLDAMETPLTDEDLLHLRNCRSIERLWLSGTNLTDASVPWIVQNRNITHLALDRTEISDASLQQIAELRELEVLALRDTRVTGAGLVHLLELSKLQHLYLRGTAIGDKHLGELKQFTHLQGLDVQQTGLSVEGERELREALPGCLFQ
jgi:hypothetical protein